MSTVQSIIDGFLKWAIVDIHPELPVVVQTYWSQWLAESTMNTPSELVISNYRQNHPHAKFVVAQVIVKYAEKSFVTPPPGYSSSDGPVVPPTSSAAKDAFGEMARKYRDHFGTTKLTSHQTIVVTKPGMPPPEQPASVPVTQKEDKPNG